MRVFFLFRGKESGDEAGTAVLRCDDLACQILPIWTIKAAQGLHRVVSDDINRSAVFRCCDLST